MVQLRYELLRKPLGLHFSDEELARETQDILLGAFEDSKILACCVLTKLDAETVRLRQMAVNKKQQGKGVGNTLMNFAERIAADMGFRTLTMHARNTAVGFYQKCGYRVVGSEFIEVGIPHHVMQKPLR